VWNNPLNATDPSGYIAAAIVGWTIGKIGASLASKFVLAKFIFTAYQVYNLGKAVLGIAQAYSAWNDGGGGAIWGNLIGGIAKGAAISWGLNNVAGYISDVNAGSLSADLKSEGGTPTQNNATSSGGDNSPGGIVDTDGWVYKGGRGGNLHGVYETVANPADYANVEHNILRTLFNFAGGLSDGYTWGLSEGITASYGVDKASSAYSAGEIGNLRGLAKSLIANGTRQVAKKIDTALYQKVDKDGNHLKYGIAKIPEKNRYTAKQMNGGKLKILARGEKKDMLKLERDLHETLPFGPEEGQKFYIKKQVAKGLKPPPYGD
jgi:hypothetical protein